MKYVKWLLSLTDNNPLKFSIALMLIAILVLGAVVKYQENKLVAWEEHTKSLENQYYKKIDSLNNIYRIREDVLNLKMEETLNHIIEDYKQQIEESKQLGTLVSKTIKKNRRIISRNKTQLKTLKK